MGMPLLDSGWDLVNFRSQHNLSTIQCYLRFQHGNGTHIDGSVLSTTETSLSIFPVLLLVNCIKSTSLNSEGLACHC